MLWLRAGKRLRDLQSGSTFEETFQKFADSIFASGHLLLLNTNRISRHTVCPTTFEKYKAAAYGQETNAGNQVLRELAGSVLGSRLAGTDLATGIEFWADYELTDQAGGPILFITSNADSDDVVQKSACRKFTSSIRGNVLLRYSGEACPFVFCGKLLGYFCEGQRLKFYWRRGPGWEQSGSPRAL